MIVAHARTYLLLTIGAFLIGVVGCERSNKEKEFVKRELNGVVIDWTDDGHDVYYLSIRESGANETLKYPLMIGKFLRDNNIQKMDSISKEQNSGKVSFYRKKDGVYSKIAVLKYY